MANELIVTNAVALAALVDKSTGDTLTAAEYTTLKDSLQEANTATRAANVVFSGPTTGSAAAPTFRALVAADIPSLSAVYQPVDATLTALAALGAGPGFLQVTAQDTFSIAALSGAQVNTALGYTAADNAALAGLQPIDATLTALAALATLGAANQIIRTNAGATALEWADPAGGISGLTAGRVVLATGATSIADDAGLTYDSGTNVLTAGGVTAGAYLPAVNQTTVIGEVANSFLRVHAQQFISPGILTLESAGTYTAFRSAGTLLWFIDGGSAVSTGGPATLCPFGNGTIDIGDPTHALRALYANSMQGARTKTLTESTPTAFVRVDVASGSHASGEIHYEVYATDGTDHQVRSGVVPFSIVNKAGAESIAFGTPGAEAESFVESAGASTLSIAWSGDTAPTNGVNLQCDAASSLTQTTLALQYFVHITSGTAATADL